MLVSKVSDSRHFDLLQHLPPGNNPLPIVSTEPIPARLKQIDLEKGGGSNSRSDGTDQRVEATPVDMTEVQRMIDSAMKKGPKFPKFIHLYPAYVETFGYPKGSRSQILAFLPVNRLCLRWSTWLVSPRNAGMLIVISISYGCSTSH
ncbi:hypothetical protein ACFX2G_041984 [Malus domestica]